MNVYDSKKYLDDILDTTKLSLPWEKLSGKSVAISGGTGMIGSFLVDVLMRRNEEFGADTHVYVLGRSKEKMQNRFACYVENEKLHFIEWDINRPVSRENETEMGKMDYIIHAASNTHPVAYANDPIGTISANVMGLSNLLEWACACENTRFCFLSSVEIYGENRGDTDQFAEDYLGYIDCNTMRAGYPESKRTGEALCQAYIRQKGLDIVIPRLSRVYGPTMLSTDTKALSQFIKKGVNKEDIVLKSEGTQLFSYCYVADAVSGILKILLDGTCGEAYNLASADSDIMLRDLAAIIAKEAGKQVIFELPDAVEQAGYSKATKATLNIMKLLSIGWQSDYSIEKGLNHTISILREIM